MKTAEENPYVRSVEITKVYPRQINIKINDIVGIKVKDFWMEWLYNKMKD